MQEIKIQANKPQGEFLKLPQRFRAFCSGYGGGKTWIGCISLCLASIQYPRMNLGYFAPSYPQIRDIFYPTIEEVAHSMGFTCEIKQGNKEVILLYNGYPRTTIICRSMALPHTIIGFKIAHALIDELDTLPTHKARESWRKIMARMRYVGAKNSIDVTTTPEGFKFVYEEFVKKVSEDAKRKERYGLVQASTYDNAANLPDDYIPSLYESYPQELRDAYINGQFVNLTAGTVYRSYDRIKHNSSETIKAGEPLYIGMDFNVEHMAAVIYVKRKNDEHKELWHAVAELKEVFDTPDMIKLLKEKYQSDKKGSKKHAITIYPDASGNNRKSANAAESDIALLRQANFTIKVNSRNPAVKDRIMATNKAFEDMRVFINADSCPTTASCLEQLAYNVNGEPDKTSGFDHQCDAATYPISYEMPIRERLTHFKI